MIKFPRKGRTYHIDSYRVSQYEEKRVVDDVTVVAYPRHLEKVLVYSPYLRANVLIPRKELQTMRGRK